MARCHVKGAVVCEAEQSNHAVHLGHSPGSGRWFQSRITGPFGPRSIRRPGNSHTADHSRLQEAMQSESAWTVAARQQSWLLIPLPRLSTRGRSRPDEAGAAARVWITRRRRTWNLLVTWPAAVPTPRSGHGHVVATLGGSSADHRPRPRHLCRDLREHRPKRASYQVDWPQEVGVIPPKESP